jgi:catechol 2,3-dioxygenase-like lactoylglutathione lyase family enzyme
VTPAGLHHVAIKAADPERVAAFYRDVLGLPELARHALPDGSLRSVWLGCGEAILMVERAVAAGSGPRDFSEDPPGLHLVALRIAPEDRDAWRARLAVVHETAHTLYVQDPEGNRVGLSTYVIPPRSSG